MKKLFLLLFSVLAFTSQVRADVEWTIWEGEITQGNVQGKSKLDFSILEEGDMICVYGTGTLSKAISRVSGNDWGTWTSLQSYAPAVDATYGYYHVVTADFLTNFNYSSDETKCWAVQNWNDGTITKVTIKKAKSAIRTTLSSVTKNTDDNFEYTIPKADLSNMVEGDFIRLSTSQRSEVSGKGYKIEFKQTNDKGSTYTTLWGPTHDAIWRIDNTAITDGIKNYPLYIYGELYNSNGVYLYHPINSFKIGSIGMATFSAAQKVKVPEGLTAYKATVSGNNVTLTPFTNNIIPADQGAIIKGPQGSVVEFEATSEGSSDISDLIAVTTETAVTSLPSGYDYYVLYAGTGEKEESLALSTLLGGFGGWTAPNISWNASNYTATYNGAESNRQGGWVGKDWSAYDKLKLNFSANTLNADATFYVAYNGHDDATTEATLTQGSTSSIEIDLNSNYKDAIGNFSMWSGATSGSITFKSAALIDNDGATVAEFRKTESGTIAANKAYLRIEKSETPSKLNIVFAEDENKQEEEQQGETNSIRNIANTNVNNNVVYNMNGQRVGSDYKGLVIVNGKKIIKK